MLKLHAILSVTTLMFLLAACGPAASAHPIQSADPEKEVRTEVEGEDPQPDPGPEDTTEEFYEEDEEMAPPAG